MFLRELVHTVAAKSYGESTIVGRESGEKQPKPTAGVAAREDVPPSSESSHGDDGSREGEIVSAETGIAKPVENLTFGREQQQLKFYGGMIAVGTLAVCSYSRHHESRRVAVRTLR